MADTARTTVTSTRTPVLLAAGAAAGPLYVGVGTIEAIVRDGFDIRVHPLSVLANGPGGWIHIALLTTTGLLTIAGAAGLARSALRVPRGGVIGLAIFGLGVTVSGPLRADPTDGFPAGTPSGPPETISWHGAGHFFAGAVGFLALVVACLIFARWFRRGGQTGWAVFSLVAGVLYVAPFVSLAFGAGTTTVNLALTVAVIVGWAWISLLLVKARDADER